MNAFTYEVMMSKTATLTSSLMVKKGQAAPTAPASMLATARPSPAATQPKTQTALDYYKALTVKLDRDRYETLKSAGIKLDKKSQDIFVEALDLWLKQAAPQSA